MDQGETVVLNNPEISKPSSSPWGNTPLVAPCSLSSVMDEELARDLQEKEEEMSALQVELPFVGVYLYNTYIIMDVCRRYICYNHR